MLLAQRLSLNTGKEGTALGQLVVEDPTVRGVDRGDRVASSQGNGITLFGCEHAAHGLMSEACQILGRRAEPEHSSCAIVGNPALFNEVVRNERTPLRLKLTRTIQDSSVTLALRQMPLDGAADWVDILLAHAAKAAMRTAANDERTAEPPPTDAELGDRVSAEELVTVLGHQSEPALIRLEAPRGGPGCAGGSPDLGHGGVHCLVASLRTGVAAQTLFHSGLIAT